jgi:hypothetical protein
VVEVLEVLTALQFQVATVEVELAHHLWFRVQLMELQTLAVEVGALAALQEREPEQTVDLEW